MGMKFSVLMKHRMDEELSKRSSYLSLIGRSMLGFVFFKWVQRKAVFWGGKAHTQMLSLMLGRWEFLISVCQCTV